MDNSPVAALFQLPTMMGFFGRGHGERSAEPRAQVERRADDVVRIPGDRRVEAVLVQNVGVVLHDHAVLLAVQGVD